MFFDSFSRNFQRKSFEKEKKEKVSSGHPYRIVENLIRTGSLIDFYRRRKGKREERRFTFRLVFKKIQSRFKKEKKEKVSSDHPYRIVENLDRTGRKTGDVRLIFVEEKKEKNKR